MRKNVLSITRNTLKKKTIQNLNWSLVITVLHMPVLSGVWTTNATEKLRCSPFTMHFSDLLPHSKAAEMARTNSLFLFQDLKAVCWMGLKGLYLFLLYIVEKYIHIFQ